MSKLCFLYIALISFQARHIFGRFVKDNVSSLNQVDSNRTNGNGNGLASVSLDQTFLSKELTDGDINKMKQSMSTELSPVQLEHLSQLLSKFKKGTSAKDHIEGMIGLLVFGVAAKSNATDVEINQLFGDGSQTTTANPITLNNTI